MTRRRRVVALVAGALLAGTVAACSGGSDDAGPTTTTRPSSTTSPTAATDSLRLDQIQVIGTHNSFHVAPDPAELALLAAQNPDQAAHRTYTHAPIPEQLDTEQIRQFELDIYRDAKGGLFAHPKFREQADLGPTDPVMAKPGIKVMHEQDIDYRSVCLTLRQCLTEIKAWSDAHPTHVPIAIGIQFKDGPLIFNVPDYAKAELWRPDTMDELDAEITAVFPRDRIIAPDDVRGTHATLEEAVLAHEWPTLGESRGKVMFLMVNPDPYRTWYLEGHEGLKGRLLFTNAQPGQPDASYIDIDDPLEEPGRIAELVHKGYLVRTRADSPGPKGEAARGDTARLEAALASGAQWVGTDYPGPGGAKSQYGTDYVAELPGFLAARCNPVTAPDDCPDDRVEPRTG